VGHLRAIPVPERRARRRVGKHRVTLAGLTTLTSLLPATTSPLLLFGTLAVFLFGDAGLYTSVGGSLLTKLFNDTDRALWPHVPGGSLAGFVASETAVSSPVVPQMRSSAASDTLLYPCFARWRS
jgi:hypothetical protein